MTRIVLVRHGKTVWNRESRYQGQIDIPLSEEGMEQARRVRDWLKDEKFDAVYASDMSRSIQTAQIILGDRSLPINQIPALKEISFGIWEGLTFKEISQQYPDMVCSLYKEARKLKIPKGETFEEVLERALPAFLDIVHRHPDQNVLIVSHGATIRAIICGLLRMDIDNVWQIGQVNAAINVLEFYEDDRCIVSLLNETRHLQ